MINKRKSLLGNSMTSKARHSDVISNSLTFSSEYTRGIDHTSFHGSSWLQTSLYRNSGLHALTDQGGDTSFAFEIPEGLPNAVRSSEEEETASISIRQISRYHNFESPNDHRMALPTKESSRQHRKSRNDIFCPSVPLCVVKRLASSFVRSSGTLRTKVNRDTLDALIQAGDWFLEQVGSDLGAFAEHAGRKTIDETDAAILMKRSAVFSA